MSCNVEMCRCSLHIGGKDLSLILSTVQNIYTNNLGAILRMCQCLYWIFSSIGALEMAMLVCRSVGFIQLFSSILCMQRLFLAQSSLVQTSIDQFSLLQSNLVKSTLVKSSQILSNLVKSTQIQKTLFQAISGSIQRMWRLFIVQSCLDQTIEDQFSLLQSNLVKSSQIQSNLVKSSQIYSNLENSFLGYFWQHIVHVAAIYSLVMSRLDQ